LNYIRGVAPAFVPVNLAFGSAFHEALAGYYSEIEISGDPFLASLRGDPRYTALLEEMRLPLD